MAVAALSAFASAAMANDAPRFSDPKDRIARPDLSGLPRLRFLTSLNYPPFNFADAQGKPSGFNVEIARALCDVLDIEAKCEIQAMPWDELDAALDGLRGEAIIAGHRASVELRSARDLSTPYFRQPARFVVSKDAESAGGDMTAATRGKTVAVVAGTAHEAMLKTWFPEADRLPVTDVEALYTALKDGQAEFMFGDGVALSFWLATPVGRSCCQFVSGPYLSEYFFGPGMAIVVRKGNPSLVTALNSALQAIDENGVYAEIYARYFPVDPFANMPESGASEPGEGKAQRPEQSG
jgi:polar amino acid transport system substrate-binding protein